MWAHLVREVMVRSVRVASVACKAILTGIDFRKRRVKHSNITHQQAVKAKRKAAGAGARARKAAKIHSCCSIEVVGVTPVPSARVETWTLLLKVKITRKAVMKEEMTVLKNQKPTKRTFEDCS